MQQKLIDFVGHKHDVPTKGLAPYSGSRAGQPRRKKPENPRNQLLVKLDQSCSLFASYETLSHKYFQTNGIEKPNDPAIFFNRKLTNLATSFMKRIQQDLIAICWYLEITFSCHTAVPNDIYHKYKYQDWNYYISQSSNLATIKCSNRNIFVSLDALKRSEYFRSSLYPTSLKFKLLKLIKIGDNSTK